MLLTEQAVVYANDATEWAELMSFLKEHEFRIHGDRFWRSSRDSYMAQGPDKYEADPSWWCVSVYDFILRNQYHEQPELELDIALLEELL